MIINYQNISKWANLSGFRLALRHPGITHTSFLPIIELQTWADWAKFEKNQFWSCKQQEGRTTKIRIFNMCSYGLPFWKSKFFFIEHCLSRFQWHQNRTRVLCERNGEKMRFAILSQVPRSPFLLSTFSSRKREKGSFLKYLQLLLFHQRKSYQWLLENKPFWRRWKSLSIISFSTHNLLNKSKSFECELTPTDEFFL